MADPTYDFAKREKLMLKDQELILEKNSVEERTYWQRISVFLVRNSMTIRHLCFSSSFPNLASPD